MNEQLATDLGHLVEELAKEARPTEPANLARLGEQVASLFKAKSDEVAVLALTGQDKFLKFIIPEKLQAIGTLPMTSTSALAVRTAREQRAQRDALHHRYRTLTPRERDVLALVVTGLLNKQIAAELGTSEAAVKVHRQHVMAKMGAGSLAALVRMADRLGIPTPQG